MATEIQRWRPTTAPPAPAADPFFYGWRYVPRIDAHNRQIWEKIPLTPWDVLHPEEEDFIVTNDAHDRAIHYLKDVFEERLAGRPGMLVLCDHRVLWGDPALGAHGPDVAVFENLNKEWDTHRGTFPMREMGARPLLVVEVTSPSTRYLDLDDKVEDYFRAGVPLYIIADQRDTQTGAFIRLMAYRTTPEGYVRVPDDPKGVWVEGLRLWVQAEGDRVVCSDEHGNRIPDLRTQRELEKQRADSEKQRADSEKQRADSATQKQLELEAEIKRLRGDTK